MDSVVDDLDPFVVLWLTVLCSIMEWINNRLPHIIAVYDRNSLILSPSHPLHIVAP